MSGFVDCYKYVQETLFRCNRLCDGNSYIIFQLTKNLKGVVVLSGKMGT